MVYSVLIISYEDDYKHRYDNGVYPNPIELFESYSDAKDYVIKCLLDEMEEHFFNCFDNEDDIKKSYPEFFNVFKIIYEKDGESWDKIELIDKDSEPDILKEYLKGEFVDYLIDYEITESKIKRKKKK